MKNSFLNFRKKLFKVIEFPKIVYSTNEAKVQIFNNFATRGSNLKKIIKCLFFLIKKNYLLSKFQFPSFNILVVGIGNRVK